MRGGHPAGSSRPWGRAQRMLGVQQWIAHVVAPPSLAVWLTRDPACRQHGWPVCNMYMITGYASHVRSYWNRTIDNCGITKCSKLQQTEACQCLPSVLCSREWWITASDRSTVSSNWTTAFIKQVLPKFGSAIRSCTHITENLYTAKSTQGDAEQQQVDTTNWKTLQKLWHCWHTR